MTDETESSPCTVDELLNILTAPSGGMMMLPSHDLDEVYPGLYIGDSHAAKNAVQLKRLGISHVLNTAEGNTSFHVTTGPGYYKRSGVHYMGIEATDHMNHPLNEHFIQTSDYIGAALKNDGRVLVNCREGVSRSSTIVLAFLMIKRHMTAPDAVRTVRASREIAPNDGFLQQLCDLNERLLKKGHFDKRSDEATVGVDPHEGQNLHVTTSAPTNTS